MRCASPLLAVLAGSVACTSRPDARVVSDVDAGAIADTKADTIAPIDAADAPAPDGGVRPFTHPGLLHSADDLARMKAKVAASAQPWLSGWQRLVANRHSALSWTPSPAAIVYRGADGTHAENYAQLYNDAAA